MVAIRTRGKLLSARRNHGGSYAKRLPLEVLKHYELMKVCAEKLAALKKCLETSDHSADVPSFVGVFY